MNDKKKLAVVIVLVLAVLGIGAFQFVNMTSTPAPQAKAEEPPKAVEEEPTVEAGPTPMVAELYRVGMTVRDPFQEGSLPLLEGMTPPPAATTPPAANPAPPRPPRPSSFAPPPLAGNFNPLPVAGDGIGVQPSTPLRQPGEFSFSVSGVITGAKPAAVFVDDSGNQRLVTVGGSLDGDSRLVGVEKGKVTILHKGKTKTIQVGGTPNVK